MPLFDKPLTTLKEADLAALISDRESEGKTLDYKRDLVGRTDEAKKEFLYDVTSFANTSGGDLIFGMDEDAGIPITLNGIPGIDADAEVLRLQQMVRDGVRPAIIGLQTWPVPLSNGNIAVVLRIPKSWNPPHQVTYQKAFRFYARASNGKYQLDVDELRQIFALSAAATERLKHFRVDRIAKIVAREVPVALEAGPLMVLHVLPLGAFAGGSQADLHRVWRASDLLVGVLGSGGTPMFNADGLILESAQSYVQVFRDGCIEVVGGWSIETANRRSLPGDRLERDVIAQVSGAQRLLQEAATTPPLVLALALTGMKGWSIASIGGTSRGRFDRDPILNAEMVVQEFKPPQHELKTLFDAVWNAAGSPNSPNYDSQGRRLQNR